MNYDGQSVARSPVHKKVQHLKRPNYSVVCCIFHSKQISYECSQRPYNRDDYGMWLSRLFVRLSEAEVTNCTIVLNNVPFHRSMAIQQTFSAHGHKAMLLLPYAPFLNPIEEFFSKWKGLVKRPSPTSLTELQEALPLCPNLVTEANCNASFDHMAAYLGTCSRSEEILSG